MRSPEPNSPSKSAHDLLSPDVAKSFEKAAPLPKTFYLRDTAKVARDLLGKGFFIQRPGELLVTEIVEVEAYLGERDPASHAYRGPTPRNWAMFLSGGTCYVYLSYGINYCMNVSTQKEGIGEAVLIRAVAPLYGVSDMQKRRGISRTGHAWGNQLTNGPGKLTAALGIDLTYNGFTFDREDFKLVDLGKRVPSSLIGSSPRIGISNSKDLELRFFVKNSTWLSRKLPH